MTEHAAMGCERGQAAVEWIALIVVTALLLGVATSAAPVVDGRSLGGALAHRIVCAAGGGCDDGDRDLRAAYGPRDAALVRRHLPGLVYEPGERQLPVDWRSCRAIACADAADDRDLDVHRSDAGRQATAFTRLLRRRGRRYIQYWLYYPDSNTAWAGSDRLWNDTPLGSLAELVGGADGYPGWHADDWEGAAVRIEPDGRVAVRVTSHGRWQWCKRSYCAGRWGPPTGWVRVSRGSHANHVPATSSAPTARGRGLPSRRARQLPGVALRERTTTPDGIRLVPLEAIDHGGYRRLDPGVAPPWRKDAYSNPESPTS